MRTIVDSNPAFRKIIGQNSLLKPEDGENQLTDKQLLEQLDANLELQASAEDDDLSQAQQDILTGQRDRAFSEIARRQGQRVSEREVTRQPGGRIGAFFGRNPVTETEQFLEPIGGELPQPQPQGGFGFGGAAADPNSLPDIPASGALDRLAPEPLSVEDDPVAAQAEGSPELQALAPFIKQAMRQLGPAVTPEQVLELAQQLKEQNR
jgi:hypothetical protein